MTSPPEPGAEPAGRQSGSAGAFLARHWVALVLFPVLAAIFLAEVLFLPRHLSGFDTIFSHDGWQWRAPGYIAHQPSLIDSPTAHYPQRQLEWDSFRRGHNFDFNPYIFGGMIAMPQGAGAFLTSLPQLFLDVPDAIDWSTWIRLSLAGLLMYAFCVFAGLGRAPALLGGVIWAYNLHQVVWLQFPQHLATQLWMPLMLLLCLSVIRDGPGRAGIAGLLLVNVLFFTSGYHQGVLYTYLMLGAFNTVYLLLNPGHGALERLKRWCTVHAALLVSIAVVGVEVALHGQAIDTGLRGAQHWRTPETPPLELSTLANFASSLLPSIGELTTRYYTPNYWGGLWGEEFRATVPTNLVESAGYFGIVALLLCLFAVFALGDRRRRALPVALVVVSLCAFAVFQRDPLALKVMSLVPMGDRGNFSRMITLIVFCGSIIAAVGLHALLQRARRGWPLALWLVAAVFALPPLVAFGIAEEFRPSRMLYPGAVTAGFLLVATVLLRWWPRRRWLAALAIVFVTADLFHAGYSFNTRTDAAAVFPTNHTLRYLLADHEPFRVATIAEEHVYHPNTLAYYRIPIIEGYSTVAPLSYLHLLRALFENSWVTHNGIVFLTDPFVPALRMLGVRYVLSERSLEVEGLTHVLHNDGAHLHELDDPLPRVYCATHAEIEREPGAGLWLVRPRLLEHDRPLIVSSAAGPLGELDPGCAIHDIEVHTSRIDFTVESPAPTWVAVPYGHSPHWQASLSGTEIPVVRANHTLMAIAVPAGRHAIELRWHNRGQQLAAAVLVGFGLLLLFALALGRWHPAVRILLGGGALIVIAKAAFSLPPLYNDRIPENPAAEVDRAGIATAGLTPERHRRTSTQIRAGTPFRTEFEAPKPGLQAVAVRLATYEQKRFEHDIEMTLYDAEGDVPLAHVRYPAGDPRVADIAWLWLEFEPLPDSLGHRYRLEVAAPDSTRRPLAVWLDDDDEPVLITLHDLVLARGVQTDPAQPGSAGVD